MYNCSKCSFNSEFDFSVATHEKLDHSLNLRREPYHCYTSCIEKRLCPEWDYDTHLKVDLDNHVRRRHDWGRKKKFYEFHDDIETIEKQCDNCNFKTYSNFLSMLHVHVRGRDDNCLLLDQILLIMDVKGVYISNETNVPKEISTEIETSSTKTFKFFYCYNCSFKSKYKCSLKTHIFRKHMQREWFYCDKCSHKTHAKLNLKMHKLGKHMADDQVKWFNCARCSYKAKFKASISRHMKIKHASNELEATFECDHCPFKTHKKHNLKVHVYSKHTPDDQIQWFKCEQCSYKGKASFQLTQHIKRIHSSNDHYFKCDHCPFKTYMKDYLKKHEYVKHTPDDQFKWFKCEQCSYKGKLSFLLTNHIKRIHSSKDK